MKLKAKRILGGAIMSKVLLISTCNEKLHELEFVKPIKSILCELDETFFVKHYSKLTKEDLGSCSKIIICGTSLKDNLFLKDIKSFSWLKFFNKPVLGICAGMQILGLVYGGELKKKKEIGLLFENFENNFLGLEGSEEVHQVYHLHGNYVDFTKLNDFDIAVRSNYEEKIALAVKHKEKPIYGVLFHPEVRQKEMIKKFINKK